MNNKLTLTGKELVIEPLGLDKLWSLTGSIAVSWNHVRGATHDPGMKHEPKGLRAPGLRAGQNYRARSTLTVDASSGTLMVMRTLLSSSLKTNALTG